MRKQYSKPNIVFESFSLSVSIANCDFIVDTANGGDCALIFDGVRVFTSEVEACKPKNGGTIIEDDPSNGFCYHVPIDTMNLFNS